jgi:hypothetical protein
MLLVAVGCTASRHGDRVGALCSRHRHALLLLL